MANKASIIVNEFFDDFNDGKYSALPEELYDLVVMAVQNQNLKTIRVNCVTRPGKIEDAIKYYELTGIKSKPVGDIFNLSYVIELDTKAFLSNVWKFYNVSKESVDMLYRSKEKARKKARNKEEAAWRADNPNRILKRTHPRDRGVVIFRSKIGDSNENSRIKVG